MKKILRCAQDDSAAAEPPAFTSKLATRHGQIAPLSTYLAYVTPSAGPESIETSPLLSLFDPLPTGRTVDEQEP